MSTADLHPRNIIIDRGRVSEIVDWECATFYPEYWEFTKLFYGLQLIPEIQDVIHDAFMGDTYEEELKAER
ncbi:Aminoglycoside phosphotransferase [Penicillium cf. griseofulvum]|uniref:Aminoglycoside phosphotransferase n=1 Tax=Penicillium cf. griseofulvum TaxID=2972120 RepID=A0A9W9M4F7_9EURO|nr:Aminoglycoside phosphotransferase [Penicillium cf. griseofulvum]KAJ5434139.1 Aminoglycoside phosphotransferase [Penicillium cf. griseofulvum]KAJ5451966.1 Aminoglycoside phosphotransferase [Penicillium cf. griseofulvum]